MTGTMTSKGQITIPKEVRERLNLKPGSRVDFVFEEPGKVTLRPFQSDFRRLRGIVKSPFRRPLTIREMDEAIAQGIAESVDRK